MWEGYIKKAWQYDKLPGHRNSISAFHIYWQSILLLQQINTNPTVVRYRPYKWDNHWNNCHMKEAQAKFLKALFPALFLVRWSVRWSKRAGKNKKEERERERGGNACEISFQKVIPTILLASNPALVLRPYQSSSEWQTALCTEYFLNNKICMYIQEKTFIFDLCKWTHPLTLKMKELESNSYTFSAGDFQSEITDQLLSKDNNTIQECH